ncbi:hypothetical protein [Brevundimonas sp. Root1423]|uniref:hypothetical protein n=1 Tax=Brevundimonas sp. Root1423 TaxID=1736462 RepID=UPI0007023968|nr:hypothetical protein [Brevundimonas sp. Root1423]KQY89516.1 hypothetical protein ASD25_02720 [Brevundimonas sp. Root1423]
MSTSLTALATTGHAHRVVIEPAAEGAYLFVFEGDGSAFRERDYLLDDVDKAKLVALEEFGIASDSWRVWTGASLV